MNEENYLDLKNEEYFKVYNYVEEKNDLINKTTKEINIKNN